MSWKLQHAQYDSIQILLGVTGVKAHSNADGLGDVDAWQSEEKRLWTLGNILVRSVSIFFRPRIKPDDTTILLALATSK